MDILKIKEVWDYLVIKNKPDLALAIEEVIYLLEELDDDNYEITIKEHILEKRDIKDEDLVPDTDEEVETEIDSQGFHSIK
tara:strand:+ start:6 stop:248 length:243 start_codon:yes stop_codon:yes gene_type:complete